MSNANMTYHNSTGSIPVLPNTTIPIPVVKGPATDPHIAHFNFSDILNSSHTLPVPQADGAPYGGTPEHPTWFYNRTLGQDDIVCGTSDWRIRQSCCPRSIGIMSGPEVALGANCRMQNRTENSEYFLNCTKQMGAEHDVPDVQSACWSLGEFMDKTSERRRKDLSDKMTNEGHCWTVPLASGPNMFNWAGNNYTDSCCERIGGRVVSYDMVGELIVSMQENRSNWVGVQCAIKDKGKQDEFVKCAEEHTWAVCENAGSMPQASLLLLAAATGLALLV